MIGETRGCGSGTVRQSPAVVTAQRGESLKLSCTFDKLLQHKKLSLVWRRKLPAGEEEIYPAQGSSRFHVNAEAFKSRQDAGLEIRDVTGRDSGLYLCHITFHQSGNKTQCQGNGTHLTVQATPLDRMMACLPLGVIIAALLVLHGMLYRQWKESRRVDAAEEESQHFYRLICSLRCDWRRNAGE